MRPCSTTMMSSPAPCSSAVPPATANIRRAKTKWTPSEISQVRRRTMTRTGLVTSPICFWLRQEGDSRVATLAHAAKDIHHLAIGTFLVGTDIDHRVALGGAQ